MSNKIYLTPLWVRLWHVLNAFLFIVLILTGLSLHYAELPLISFYWSVKLHDVAGVILTINYMLFVLGNAVSKNGEYYRLDFKGVGDRLKKQFYYYTQGMFKGEASPFPVSEERKFNPLQKVTYLVVIYIMLPIICFTGFIMLMPDFFDLSQFGINATLINNVSHVVVGFFLLVFIFVHIYLCTLGKTPTSNFKSMVDGYHEPH